MVHLSLVRMIRSRGPDRYWRKRFYLDQSTQYFGRRRNCFSVAVRAVRRAWQNSTAGRKKKKGQMRRLWNLRISAAVQEHGLTYGPFIGNLLKHNIRLDRKVLSHIAIYEPKTFKCLAELASQKHKEGLLATLAKNPEGLLSGPVTQDDLLAESVRKLRLSSNPSASS